MRGDGVTLLAYVLVGEAENVSDNRRSVGRYRTYEAIAAGGMATVHYGRMLGPLGFARTVAIKKLHQEYARDPEFVAMFIEEARLAARIHHPNVVHTLDVVNANGEIALVMEYVPAVSLAQLLFAAESRGERLPSAVSAAIMVGVLQGLHAAHEATDEAGNPLDIVHRDVSPQNILVGGDGCARVLDFGIAKATGRATQATREGQVKGKFAYMAPEQITSVGVTRQSDIFAASIVLWEALTGRRLFTGDSGPAVLARVLSAPIVPPSKVVPDLARELDAIVLRGLARDLTARYATGRDMARDLEAHTSLGAASQVGEWVERLAGDELAQRAARVAEIENASRADRVSVFVEAGLQPTIPTLPAGAPVPERLSGRRYRAVAIVAVAVVGATALGARVLSGRTPAPRAAVGGEPSQGDKVSASSDTAQTPPDVKLPPLTEGPSAVVRPPQASVSKQRPAETKPLPPVRSAPSSTPAQTTGQAACDPPYYADAKGHLIYKPECFQ